MSEENIQTAEQATEVEVATESSNQGETTTPGIDYQKKFSESSKEALRLLEETKAKDAEIERLKKLAESGAATTANETELYPGFETLTEAEQENLLAYTNSIKKGLKEELYKDPAIAHSRRIFAEAKWNEAFNDVSNKFPELKNDAEFKQKYFNADNVPDNIGDILNDLAKVHLFDKARDLGARDAQEKSNHIEIERAGAGDKTPTSSSRSLEDWQRMAQENPGQFAKLAKEFKSDLESGKLK